MKAIYLTQYGAADQAFEVRETEAPGVSSTEVLIAVDAFGLNYADVIARNGMYKDAPDLPGILGYECVGRVEEVGEEVKGLQVGQRVAAFTRFGAYAEKVKTDHRAVVAIPDDMPNGVAVALATQYCTAWYSAMEVMNLYPGNQVLIHAAAGGVGTALVQICKWKGCTIFGTAGSPEKLTYLKDLGVDYPINYRKSNFVKEVLKITKKPVLDAVFDPIGGKVFKRSTKLLGHGGKAVIFGASSREKKGMMAVLKLVFGYGFHTPIALLMKSQSWLGVNMLRVADYKPELIQKGMLEVLQMYKEGIAKPHVGGVFKASEIASAHHLLESRNSMGKIVVEWEK
ncbi:zinc-binding dehydrogenase [bacterium SCSIO 12741]|nr:zinc-binding dehydrogenase [bacterium SCSIO 12741]